MVIAIVWRGKTHTTPPLRHFAVGFEGQVQKRRFNLTGCGQKILENT